MVINVYLEHMSVTRAEYLVTQVPFTLAFHRAANPSRKNLIPVATNHIHCSDRLVPAAIHVSLHTQGLPAVVTAKFTVCRRLSDQSQIAADTDSLSLHCMDPAAAAVNPSHRNLLVFAAEI